MRTKTEFKFAADPSDPDDVSTNETFNENYIGFAFSVGRKIFDFGRGGTLAVGGEIDFLIGKTDMPYVEEITDHSWELRDITFDRIAVPLLVTINWESAELLGGKLGLSAGVSLGFMPTGGKVSSPYAEREMPSGYIDSFEAEDFSDVTSTSVWGVHAGVNYKFTKHFYGEISYRVIFTGGIDWNFGENSDGDTIILSEKGKVAHQINFSVGWRF